MLTQQTGIHTCLRLSKVRFSALQGIGAADLCSTVRISALAWRATLHEWKSILISWAAGHAWLMPALLEAGHQPHRQALVEKKAEKSSILDEFQIMDV